MNNSLKDALKTFNNIVWKPMRAWIWGRLGENQTSGHLADEVFVDYIVKNGIVKISVAYRNGGRQSAELEAKLSDADYPNELTLKAQTGTDDEVAQLLHNFTNFVQYQSFYTASHPNDPA